MAVLLALAVVGLAIRHFAPNPSTLRDIGTLMLVLWLPAVGNLVAYLIRRLPKRPPPVRPATEFAPDAPFTPHLQAELKPARGKATWQGGTRCMLVKGRNAFTARLERPLSGEDERMGIELLHPAAALPHLAAGEAFHVVVGRTAVAAGRVA